MVDVASSRMVKETLHKMVTMISDDYHERPKSRANDYSESLRE